MEICGIKQYMTYLEHYFGIKESMESDYIRYTLPQEIGEGFFELFHSPGKYQVWITNAQTKLDIDMSYTQDENTYIGMSYVEIDSCRENMIDRSDSDIHSWRTSCSLPSDSIVYGVCKAGKPIYAVNVILFKEFFLNCSEKYNADQYFDVIKTIQSFDEQAFMHELYPILAEMLHSSYKETAKKLFIKSNIYAIAAHLISLCDAERTHPNVTLSKFDIQQIRSIPSILREQMSDPPSIPSLSRMVALNEFKLKAGFKKVFNTTIYEYLRQMRAELAIELLKKKFPLLTCNRLVP
ncbi:AraC family transcriptional regulator [Kineothrix sedimenti]|uniref:AraC family transcriptional regulator n=1 Tax=Kineothrix sedimenti TaxID=3123317 RepID=A0ABZ3F2T2_9FIRM